MTTIPTLALRPQVKMPPKRQRPTVTGECTSCGYPVTDTGECRGCSD